MLAEVTSSEHDRPDPPTYLTLQQVEMLRARVDDIISIAEASRILGCSYAHVVSFIKVGMLKRHGDAASMSYLSKAEIEAFIAPIRALGASHTTADLKPIVQIYSLIGRRICETYQCFLDCKLTSARRDPTKVGLGALLLDPGDVRRNLDLPEVTEVPDPRVEAAARILKSSVQTIGHLARRGELRVYRVQHPITRYFRKYVDLTELQQFRQTYITITELSDVFGIPTGPLAIKLDAKGLHPREVPRRVTRIYRRADVERAFNVALPGKVEDHPL